MGGLASQLTSLTIVYSTVYSRLRSKKTSSVSYPHFAGMPVCLCGKLSDIFHDVTHELHSTTNWRRHSDIRHVPNDCAPTFRHSIYLPRRCNKIKPIQPPIIRHTTYLEHTKCCKAGIPTTTIAMHCDNTAKRQFCIYIILQVQSQDTHNHPGITTTLLHC